MGRRAEVFQKGSVYHIYNRGCNKDKIFFEDRNYLFLLRKVRKYTEQFDITVIAYCFMPNHYHFIFRQNSDLEINNCVQNIFNSYTKAINKRYKRRGTLFEGKFKAKEIYEDQSVLEVCRYVHRNPLEAGLVKNLEDWQYSNYSEWIGLRSGDLCDKDFIVKNFPNPDDYKKFVLDYYSTKQMLKKLKKYI
ncbi:transposase IS200 like protein [bacterium BMS3Abin03]|nr:transposase IS200 like protein [bacterium BMS3Abin03]